MLFPTCRSVPDGLVPAIVQDATDNTVLMLAYMDREALSRTRRHQPDVVLEPESQRVLVQRRDVGKPAVRPRDPLRLRR